MVNNNIGKIKTKNKKVFICSDPHFGQESFYRYNPSYENILRPQFPNAKACDERIIHNHNSVVPSNNSVVYILGDLAKSAAALDKYIPQLNGETKILVGGNHDFKFPTFRLMQLFDKICGACYLGGRKYLLTHVPVHPDELRGLINWHGHTHQHSIDDPRYHNFCYEVNNFFPTEVTHLL